MHVRIVGYIEVGQALLCVMPVREGLGQQSEGGAPQQAESLPSDLAAAHQYVREQHESWQWPDVAPSAAAWSQLVHCVEQEGW